MNASATLNPAEFRLRYRGPFDFAQLYLSLFFAYVAYGMTTQAIERFLRHEYALGRAAVALAAFAAIGVMIWAVFASRHYRISVREGTFLLDGELDPKPLSQIKDIRIVKPLLRNRQQEVRLRFSNRSTVIVRPRPSEVEPFVHYLESQTGLTAERS